MEKITKASLFGFIHRPDVSIGIDGTAIEIKVISTGQSVRDILGQAIAYRMHYRMDPQNRDATATSLATAIRRLVANTPRSESNDS